MIETPTNVPSAFGCTGMRSTSQGLGVLKSEKIIHPSILDGTKKGIFFPVDRKHSLLRRQCAWIFGTLLPLVQRSHAGLVDSVQARMIVG